VIVITLVIESKKHKRNQNDGYQHSVQQHRIPLAEIIQYKSYKNASSAENPVTDRLSAIPLLFWKNFEMEVFEICESSP
jgi:hypothetical protein